MDVKLKDPHPNSFISPSLIVLIGHILRAQTIRRSGATIQNINPIDKYKSHGSHLVHECVCQHQRGRALRWGRAITGAVTFMKDQEVALLSQMKGSSAG